MKNKAIGISYAKIILFGEHSAVYGKPSIVLPIYSVKMQATITLTKIGKTISSQYFNGNVSEMNNNLLGIKVLINKILEYFGKPQLSFNLDIKSEIPVERGMGSSAATAVSITKAFFNLFEKKINRKLLLEIANVEESVTHGNPSGIDVAASSSNTPIWFIKDTIDLPLSFDLINYYLVIADSGIKGKTKEAVNLVKQKLLESSEANSIIDELGDITNQARKALSKSDGITLGKLMNLSQVKLSKLGVSTPKINELCKIANEYNGLGSKLTGSGLGGCVITLAKNKFDAENIALQLKKNGATKTWIQSLKNYNNPNGDES